MATPTRSGAATSGFGATGSPKTVTIGSSAPLVSAGALIAVFAHNESGARTFTAPTATGLTFTQQQNTAATTNGRSALYTATAAGAGPFTISMSQSTGSEWWGFDVVWWNTHGGLGATGVGAIISGSGAPDVPVVLTGNNSSVEFGTVDFNAADGTTRTFRSVNGSAATERTYFRDSAHYTVYGGYHPDTGGSSSGTTVHVGESAPSTQRWTGVAVEVLATAGGGTTFTVTVSTSCASTAVAVRQAQLVRATTAAASAVVVRQARRTVSATSAASAVVVRQPARILAAAAASTATAASLKARFLTLTASAAATSTRLVQARRIVTAASPSTALVVRTPQRSLAASCASTATTATLKVLLLTVSASAACTATVSRVASHVLSLAATAAATAVLARSVRLTRLTTVGDSASVVAVGPGGTPAAPPGQRPTLGVG